MSRSIAAFRVAGLVGMTIYLGLALSCARFAAVRRPERAGALADRYVRRWARATCQLIGMRVHVTGEIPHHVMVEASESGIAIAASGHYATENPGIMRLAELLDNALSANVVTYQPHAGLAGRPI